MENFVRGLVEDDPNKGQVMWRADFRDAPAFQQQLRSMGSPYAPMAFLGWGMDMGYSNPYCGNFGNDSYYMSHGSGWGRTMYAHTMFINWTMRNSAVITSPQGLRKGFGVPIEIGVFAQGTAVAQYWLEMKPIYETDAEGNRRQVGTRQEWERHTQEFVDFVQFAVLDATTKLPLVSNGAPCVFTVPGNGASWDTSQNYSSQFFTVAQEGGFFSNGPKVITTLAGTDPLLALLMGHLCTKEFSSENICYNFHPNFPINPMQVSFGFF